MQSEQLQTALDAIHDEALKLLQLELPEQAQRGLELIVSISRYGHDVRNVDEKATPQG